jgi:hypothetical protein
LNCLNDLLPSHSSKPAEAPPLLKLLADIVRESDLSAFTGVATHGGCALSTILTAFVVSVFLITWDGHER